jgi:hypothetical protein
VNTVILTMLACHVAATSLRPADAADPLREGVAEAARKILAVMEQQNVDSVSIIGLEDRTGNGVAVGPGLERMLKDSLGASFKETGGRINLRMIVKTPANDAAGLTMRVEFLLTDRRGEDVARFDDSFRKESVPLDISSPSAVLASFGKTGPVESGQPLRPHVFDEAHGSIEDGNAAKMSEDSPYAVRILTPEGQPLPLTATPQQHPFVNLPPGRRFMVEVINGADIPIAATISLDGLNSFYKSRGPSQHGDSWIIPGIGQSGSPRRHLLKGWWVDNGTADAFLATTFENSERSKMGLDRTLIGAVSVVISKAIPQNARTEERQEEISHTVTRKQRIEKRRPDGSTFTEFVEVPETRTRAITKEIYIGSGGVIDVTKVPTSRLLVGKPIGVITIRYRDPSVESSTMRR